MSKISPPVNPLGQSSFYYPSLDGLRFFAFLLVFLHHAFEGWQSSNPLSNFFLIALEKNGWAGVDLFFVLSGFLITTLLVKERQQFGEFKLKDFWIRRALRIWPLYYLALILGLFVLPHIVLSSSNPAQITYTTIKQLPLYFTFLGNWAVVAFNYPPFANISHLWTISLEEQFYLLWPFILFFCKSFRKSFLAALSLIIFAMSFRFYLAIHGVTHPGIYVDTFARLDTLSFGALAALVFCYHPEKLHQIKKIFKLPIQLIVLVALFLTLYKIYVFDPNLIRNVVFGYTLIALFMLYFVLSALEVHTFFGKFLELKPLVYLGKISYGLYVWHILGLELAGMVLPQSLKPLTGFALTLTFGIISYRLYETKFLKLKTRFSRISSRPV